MALNERIGIPRRAMTLFFVVDVSGSMDGAKIGTLNAAMEETIPMLREISEENSDAEIKIAVLEFSSGARWRTPAGPENLEHFRWTYLNADGVTDLGAACYELNSKLSTKAFMREASGSFAPAIILMSDGEPTDDWESGLNALRRNNWFKAAIKAAIAIGEDVNYDTLTEFTGLASTVIPAHNKEALKAIIKFVSVRSSQIGSTNSKTNAMMSENPDMAKNIELGAAMQEFSVELPQNGQGDW